MKRGTKTLLIIWAVIQLALAFWLAWVARETVKAVMQWTGEMQEWLWIYLPFVLAPFLGAVFTAAFLLLSRKEHKDGSAADQWRTLFWLLAVLFGVAAALELLAVVFFGVFALLRIEFLPVQP